MQVTGRQKVLLISPDQAFDGMYPYPVHHLYDRFSMVNFEKPRLDIWPRFSNVRGQLSVLSPGEVLYIPPYWCAPGGLHMLLYPSASQSCIAVQLLGNQQTSLMQPGWNP